MYVGMYIYTYELHMTQVMCNAATVSRNELTDRAKEIACHLKQSCVVFPEKHLSLVGKSIGQYSGTKPQHKPHVLFISTSEPGKGGQ